MHISQSFDGGNIEVKSLEDPRNIRLRIRRDAHSDFYQWFYFSLSGARGTACKLHIEKAGEAAYPNGFRDYRILYSYDREQWRRHETQLADDCLSVDFTPERDLVYFAYFVPYSMERHHDLIADALQSPRCRLERLGETVDGQSMDLLRIANQDAKASKNCWIIARQHPGETMAEWWMEGCIEKLLAEDDDLAQRILAEWQVFLVPNMNPDGSRRGHLRCNAVGRNLNREWAEPSAELSPEVALVKARMQETGVDFFLDVHGDESLPYCFIAGTEGLADWTEKDQARLDNYRQRLASLNADFQTAEGYPAKQPGEANLTMASAQVAQLFSCLAMTLEMPFKDTTATPDAEYGWSPARSKRLAHSCLQTLQECAEAGQL